MIGIIGAGVVGKATGESIRINSNKKVIYWDLVNDCAFDEFVNKCEVIMICTPSLQLGLNETIVNNLTTDYAFKINAINNNVVIIQKSTCLPGTADYITKNIDNPYYVMPEFLRQNTALKDSIKPNKIVVGIKHGPYINNKHIIDLLRDKNIKCTVHILSYYEAECAKIIANTLLATLISFWNEMYTILNINNKVSIAVCDDKYLKSCLRAFGKAYGGACLPKDTNALRRFLSENDKHSKILNATIVVNEFMRHEYGEQTILLSDMEDNL